MKRAAVLVLVLSTLILFGCNAQKKPAPQPEAKLIPQESTIGFSQVDLSDTPASVQKVAAAMEGRQMYVWAMDNNNSYILLNPDDDGGAVKVNKVIQRVPVQDFLWLDVYLDEGTVDAEEKKDDKSAAKMMVFRLEDTDKSINGIGFEEMEAEEEAEEKAEENKTQAAPSPAATPSTQPAPAPSVKTPPTQPKQTPAAPEVKQPQEQTPAENNETSGQNQQEPLVVGD